MDIGNQELLTIGNGPVGPFDGVIREVRLFDRSLTAEEVRSICSP